MRHWAILLVFAGAAGCAAAGGGLDAADGLDAAEELDGREDAWADEDREDGGEGTDGGEDGDGLDGDETMDAGDAGDEEADGQDANDGDAGDPGGDESLPCPEQQPHEKYCIRIGGPTCSYEISFCRDGQWQCYAEQEHPPPMPEFEDWAWRCGVYRCTVPAVTTEPPADWQDDPLDPYVPPDPATLTGEWVKLADLSSTVPIGCERQPWQYGFASALAVSPSDPRIMYAGMNTGSRNVIGVWKSVDGGATWFEARAGLGSEGCDCFECGDPLQCEFWDPGVDSLFVDPFDPDLVFASTFERGLYRTADGGRSWTKVELPLPWPEACMSTEHFGPTGPVGRGPDGVVHAAACGNYHFVSYDLGETWEDWGQVSHGQYVATWTFDPARPERIWAGMRSTPYPITGSGWVYLSEDGGRTWTKAGEDIEGFCRGRGITKNLTLCPKDSRWMATSILNCGLFVSANGGQSWSRAAEPMSDGEPFWAAFAPMADECLLFAARDRHPYGTMLSSDLGATWAMENDIAPIGWLFFDLQVPMTAVGLRCPWSYPVDGSSFEVWARR
jgi:hypothetical protein